MSQNTLKQHWKWPVGFRTMVMKVIMMMMMIMIATYYRFKSKISHKTNCTSLKIKIMFTVLVLFLGYGSLCKIMIASWNVDLAENQTKLWMAISTHASHHHHHHNRYHHCNHYHHCQMNLAKMTTRAGPQTPKCQKCYGTNFFHCVYTYKWPGKSLKVQKWI